MSKKMVLIELIIGVICMLCSIWLLLQAKDVIGTDSSPYYAAGFSCLFMFAVMCILDFISYMEHNKDK